MAEDSLIMVCSSCGSIELVQDAGDDAWLNLTRTVGRHRAKNRGCQAAQQWIGNNLEDCPYRLAGNDSDGPVN